MTRSTRIADVIGMGSRQDFTCFNFQSIVDKGRMRLTQSADQLGWSESDQPSLKKSLFSDSFDMGDRGGCLLKFFEAGAS